MWIIPNNSTTSTYAPDTRVSDLDLNEQGSILATQFMWRSNPSPSTTWRKRLGRDSWVTELSSMMLKDSHTNDFEGALISYLEDSHVSHSPVPDAEKQTQTQDTSSPQSRGVSDLQGQMLLFSKTSMESYLPDSKMTVGTTNEEHQFCFMSFVNWNDWITMQQQYRLQRQRKAHHINGTGGSSLAWPTSAVRDIKGQSGSGRQERKGNPQDTLPNAVAHYPTPSTRDYKGMNGLESTMEKLETGQRGHMGQLPNFVMILEHAGLPALVTNNDGGNPQESWATPNTMDHLSNKSPETLKRQAETVRAGRSKPSNLREQVDPVAMEIYKTGKTITANAGKLNPRWVETLMGLPIGWTMPSCACPAIIVQTNSDCLGTESYPNHVLKQSCGVSISWPTPAVFDTTGGPYKTELRDGVFRSKHDNDPDSPWYGAKLRDAVDAMEEKQ